MPLENSLNVNPYFDDYDQAKEFYQILFKPGVAVQTRELNQLQTILQNQIESFGNHIFKSGTIISGVNFSYLPSYSYVKILDTQTDGEPSLPSSYVGYYVKSNLNLTARIVSSEDGLESQSPELKTLFLQYNNSSDIDTSNGNIYYTSFVPGQQLTVFSKDYNIFSITANNGGIGFSNADSIVVSSSVIVSGNTIAFSNGETLTQSTTGVKVVIASINTTAVANSIILKVKPRTVDLSNTSVNSSVWTLSTGYDVVGGTSAASANIVSIIGQDAQATLTTDTQGIIRTVTMVSGGQDYTYLPYVTVRTSNTSATINNLDLTPQNYKTTITVGNSSINSVGVGYAFGVTEGIIYQKGHFLKVDPQILLISKYDTVPTDVAAGFSTEESFVTYNQDDSLYDNASNTTNFSAPGADRLKLTPTLIKLTSSEAAANVDFFALAEWKDGKPFKENRVTAYSVIEDEFARRTKESQGNFVVDSFLIGSREKPTQNTTHVSAVIDPGVGYVQGYRTQTNYNSYIDIERATETYTSATQNATFNYGNYVKVKELVGLFNFKAGDIISLRSAPTAYITSGTIGSGISITPSGAQIGTARIRSLVLDSGDPGTAECLYRLYLFDVSLSPGFSFRDVRSVWYDGIEDGVADINLTYDATTATSVAVLVDKTLDKMVFASGGNALKSLSDFTFQFRTVSDSTLQLTTAGQLVIGPLGSGLTFPYSDTATISSTQEKDFIIFPIANTQAAANIVGSLSVGAGAVGNLTVLGTGTTFATSLNNGDWIKIANSSASIVRQVSTIANNTQLTLKSTPNVTMATSNAVLFFPALYPIPIESRSDRTIAISGTSKTATLTINKTLASTINAMAVFNVSKTGVPVTKTINRDLFVQLHTSNNVANNVGPWALGVPSVARLKNVYLGSNSTVNTSSTDVTKHFFIDAGDDENAYRTANLVKLRTSTLSITANQFMLVKFDAFTTGGAEGFSTIDSYNIDDTLSLSNSTITINTLEVPALLTKVGDYFDMRDTLDYRPYGNTTATITTVAASASINPSNTFGLSGDDQFFPVPDSSVTFTYEAYLPRIDRVNINKNSVLSIDAGTPRLDPKAPAPPSSNAAVSVALLSIPPYPSLPASLNETTLRILDKRVGNARGVLNRLPDIYSIKPVESKSEILQPVAYTMADIGQLERRVRVIEYQTLLNSIEQSIRDKAIPSSVNPASNRFKNAFFVEGFDDDEKAQKENNEYAASIDYIDSLLKPPVRQINVEMLFDRTDGTTASSITNDITLMLPYTEVKMFDQSIKSSIITGDGHGVIFYGDTVTTPSSFSITSKRHEVVPKAKSIGSTGCCFVKGVNILLADGAIKAIENVVVGDIVIGRDGRRNIVKSLVRVPLGTRKLLSFNGSNEPFITNDHPILVNGKWSSFDPEGTQARYSVFADEPINKLQVGDYATTAIGESIQITEIKEHTADPEMYLYNFHTDGNNTYVADNFIVHNKGSGGCFVEGTQITMADGSIKLIENVNIGDMLIGKDGQHNTVLEYLRPMLGNRTLIAFNGGVPFITDDHPVLMKDGSWKSVDPDATLSRYVKLTDRNIGQLIVGDIIATPDGMGFEVTSIEHHQDREDLQLYNFSLDGNHTYVANNLVVHNKCFVAGTEVLLEDGTWKNIEDVKLHEVLVGKDNSKNKILKLHRPTLGLQDKILPHKLRLACINGKEYSVSEDHIFCTVSGWKSPNAVISKIIHKHTIEAEGFDVTDLQVGDKVITDDGKTVDIESIEFREDDPNTQLYNFWTDGNHTYHVRMAGHKHGMLVHNKCFVAGTKVLMQDGTWKNIEDVEVGESLIGENNSVNLVREFHRPTLGLQDHILPRKLLLASINGSEFSVSADHLFKTVDGWKAPDAEISNLLHKDVCTHEAITITQLNIGDKIITASGSTHEVHSIEFREDVPELQLYNFKLDSNRTYHVKLKGADESYLVHNKGCFTGDTLVNMSDGTTKQICDVKIGDLVYNYNQTKINRVVFLEKQLDYSFGFLYSPDQQQPFATANHPLYINGKLSSIAPEEIYNYYPWLGLTELIDTTNIIPANGATVYNLWVDGDHTYTVNGYGTTSIGADGGIIRRMYEQGLISYDRAMELVVKFVGLGKYTVYGMYALSQLFGKLNIGIINKITGWAWADDSKPKTHQAFYITAKVVGLVCVLMDKVRGKGL